MVPDSPEVSAVNNLPERVIVIRLEFADAPARVADPKRYRARGYRMAGNRIRLVTDRPMEVVEVHSSSVNAVNIAGVTVEYCPPAPALG
jgi:hypothetical protein